MAELATLARPYAEALYKAAASDLAGASKWVELLKVVAEDDSLQQLAQSPNVSRQQVVDLIVEVAKKEKVTLPEMAVNFINTVIDNNRLSVLPEIAVQFRELKNSQSGSFDAMIYSAFDISPTELPAVVKALETRFARKLNVTVKLEPDLIGGIRVVVGDEVFDASVKAHLEQMKVALTA